MKITSIAKLTDQILAGYRLKPQDDVSLLLTADLAELQEGARACRTNSAATTSISAPSSMGAADAVARTANTAHRLPATIRASIRTISCPKKKSCVMPKPIKMLVPTASPS